jgi:SAM-dependent methyltransferase
MKYYYREHIAGYEQMEAAGERAWHTMHGGGPYDEFPSRGFLEETLPRLRFSGARPTVLEIGCGTGVATCFLAARGFQVDAIDIIPGAIEIAGRVASERGLDINYRVHDVCELPQEGEPYDMIVDSFCLQGIVLDEDRARVFASVRSRLSPQGYYLISTAMFDDPRLSEATVLDERTGVLYNRYGERGLIDPQTATVYVELDEPPDLYEGSLQIGGVWHLPSRRHLKAPALKQELEAAGFDVLDQSGPRGEHVVCVQAGSNVSLM